MADALDPAFEATEAALLAELDAVIDPDLARRLSDFLGAHAAHSQDGGYLFGLAVGQRIHVPALASVARVGKGHEESPRCAMSAGRAEIDTHARCAASSINSRARHAGWPRCCSTESSHRRADRHASTSGEGLKKTETIDYLTRTSFADGFYERAKRGGRRRKAGAVTRASTDDP